MDRSSHSRRRSRPPSAQFGRVNGKLTYGIEGGVAGSRLPIPGCGPFHQQMHHSAPRRMGNLVGLRWLQPMKQRSEV